MAKPREELHEILCKLLGSRNVYFQPPPNLMLNYPCIVYSRTRLDKVSADDQLYLLNKRYSVTVIYTHPDSDLPEKMLFLPSCSHERHFKADNLLHDVFNLYF